MFEKMDIVFLKMCYFFETLCYFLDFYLRGLKFASYFLKKNVFRLKTWSVFLLMIKYDKIFVFFSSCKMLLRSNRMNNYNFGYL